MMTFLVTREDGSWYEIDGDVAEQIERQVRARIGADLRAVMFRCPTHSTTKTLLDAKCISCQRYAALVGAERVIAGIESPSAKAVREFRDGESTTGRDDQDGA